MKTFALNNKKLLLVVTFLCSFFSGFTQTTLAPGEIVINGFNSTDPDQFTFVILRDISANTVIKFTDNGWFATGGFRTISADGTVAWTSTSDLTCGTEVFIERIVGNPFSANIGSIVSTADSGFSLDSDGDQILAFQGLVATPTFIYAIDFNISGWSNVTGPNDTALPTGLTDGVNAISLGDTDNGIFNCSVLNEPALILDAVSTATNWNLQDSTALTLGGCYYTCCSSTTTWDGTAWNNGFPNNMTEVIINDVYNSTNDLPGSFEACSLVVNADLEIRMTDNIVVINDITINDSTLSLTTDASLVQVSDLSNVTLNGSGIGEISKDTAPINNYYEYTYWSSPFSDETIEGGLWESDPERRFWFDAINFVDAAYETNNDNNLIYGDQDDIDDDGDDWQFAISTDIMLPGVGYASHLNELGFGFPGSYRYIFEGTFNNGIIPVPVVRNDTETNDINWNFIGNPYPSAIDIDLFFTENNYNATTNPDGTLTGAVYLWSQNSIPDDANNGNENMNFTSTDYAIINRVGETAVDEEPGGDLLTPNRFIPSGQGFFVAYSDDGVSPTGDVIFNNAMRVTGNNDQFFRSTSNTEENKLSVIIKSEIGVFNQLLIGYVQGATNLYDGMAYDAPRNLAAGAAAIIYSVIEDSSRKYAIQGRDPNSLNINEVIPIGIKNTISGETEFTLSIAQLEGDFMNSHSIYLRDNLLNIDHNLSDSGYTFTSEAGEFNSRFEIFFSGTLSVDDLSLDSDELIISNERDNYLDISTIYESQISNIKIFDLLGRELYNINANNDTHVEFDIRPLRNSVFIINVTLANRKKLTKKLLNQ